MYKQELLLLKYNKDVICVIDKNQSPVCAVVTNARRNALLKNNNIPSHDPYIPRANSIFYNCSSTDCVTLTLYSLTQLSSPDLNLKSCYPKPKLTEYQCETVRYSYFKNIDKLLFLTDNISNKTFYLVDCLVYVDGGRVCHKKDENVNQDSHTKLIDTGTIVRPNETNVLSQDEFLCEEGDVGIINCDLNPFVPFQEGLMLKETVKVEGDILLKTGMYVVTLKKNCFDGWCGYSGALKATRRQSPYRPPGGKVYRCFYAKKQQVCLPLYDEARSLYNDRGWVST